MNVMYQVDIYIYIYTISHMYDLYEVHIYDLYEVHIYDLRRFLKVFGTGLRMWPRVGPNFPGKPCQGKKWAQRLASARERRDDTRRREGGR